MNSKRIARILKVRQYQLETEQVKLYQRRVEQNKAVQAVDLASHRLTTSFTHTAVRPADLCRILSFQAEASADLEREKRKLGVAKKNTADQLQSTLTTHRRKETMVKLLNRAESEEWADFENQERKLLDDVTQGRTARNLTEKW